MREGVIGRPAPTLWRLPLHPTKPMPSIFSHAIFATSAGKAYTALPMPRRFWVLTAVSAMLPDIDVAGFAFGIHYSDMLGHRGITHSFMFALIVGCLATLTAFKQGAAGMSSGALILYFTLVTASHPLLDAMTNGGLGVALFAPFDSTRYFLPFRPIEVSPIGAAFFSARGLAVLVSEMKWVWIPSLLILLVGWLYRKASVVRP